MGWLTLLFILSFVTKNLKTLKTNGVPTLKENSGQRSIIVLAGEEKNHFILYTTTSIIEKNQFI
jgi:hypothetical protein